MWVLGCWPLLHPAAHLTSLLGTWFLLSYAKRVNSQRMWDARFPAETLLNRSTSLHLTAKLTDAARVQVLNLDN